MAPHFAQAVARLEPEYRLIKVSTDEEQRLTGQFGIRSIPTLIVFKQGGEVARTAGAMQTEALVTWVHSAGC